MIPTKAGYKIHIFVFTKKMLLEKIKYRPRLSNEIQNYLDLPNFRPRRVDWSNIIPIFLHFLGGTILQHFVPPNGNWMNIRFQTKMQAQKALGRSGRVFNGTLMIGVAMCHEPPSEAVNASQILDQTGTNLDASVVSLNSSLATHNRSIRPLTQSYKAAHNEHEVSGQLCNINLKLLLVFSFFPYF